MVNLFSGLDDTDKRDFRALGFDTNGQPYSGLIIPIKAIIMLN